MSFRHDSTGLDPDAKYPLLPEGQWFPFRIFEADELESSKGHPMILTKCEVMNDERYANMDVWHYVVFLPKENKGAGISVHFRKCIGVPFGGNDLVDAEEWVGKKFMGKIVHETYNGKTNHKIAEVSPMPTSEVRAALDAQAPAGKAAADNDVPF